VPCEARGVKGDRMKNIEMNTTLNWKELWSDGFELLLIHLPDYIAEQKIYEVNDRQKERIGYRVLSANAKKVAFTLDYQSYEPSGDLYILDIETGDLKKILHSTVGTINLRGFLDDDQLLLEGYVQEENNSFTYTEKAPDKAHYFYILNFKTDRIVDLSNLGVTTVGMANAKCALNGSSFAYDQGDGFMIYNVLEKRTTHVSEKGDLAGISPNGQNVLIQQKEGYSLVDVTKDDKELVLSTKEIKNLTPIFNGYFELRFQSWSPDGRYILFGESSDRNQGKRFLLNLETKELTKV
jgi:hypothetical protein